VHSRVTRVPLLVLAIGAITILAAGCGASGSATSAGSSTSAGGSASGGAKPATSAPVSPVSALELAANRSKAVNSLTATMSIQGSTTSGDLNVSGKIKEQLHPSLLAEVDLTTFSAGGQSAPGGMSEIVTSKALYLRFPELMQAQHINKPWAEISLSSIGGAGASLSSLLNEVQSNSPVTQTQLFAHSPDVKKVGMGVVNGVPVTEYAGTYSVSQVIAALPASERAALGSSIGAAGISAVHFSIWLDDNHLPRKLVVTETGTSLTEKVTEIITSYNQPVNIQLPTRAETYVIPASQLGG
jgi:hypothetical protein